MVVVVVVDSPPDNKTDPPPFIELSKELPPLENELPFKVVVEPETDTLADPLP